MKYFYHSIRYSKTRPEAYGLIKTDEDNIFIDPKDNSQWQRRGLLDLGWGTEVGFCKLPILSFEKLLEIALTPVKKSKYAEDYSNFYGSIAILLEDYSEELLETIEYLVDKKKQINIEFFTLLKGQMLLDETILIRTTERDKIPYYRRWKKIFDSLGIQ